MSNTRASPADRERAFKGAVGGKERRKATVTGYVFAAQPLVELRLFRDQRDQGQFIDMSLPQAREMVRLLLDAIEGASDLACHDRDPSTETGDRASRVGASRDVGVDA